jgi:mono/diheme cytochrome c family protein
MEQRVLHGIPGTSMPAWRDVLESGEIAAIIAYIRESFQSASVAPANAP